MDKEITDNLAAVFKALGDPTRLQIFEFLSSCGGNVSIDDAGQIRPVNGPTVGDVCCKITGEQTVSSTISHHLKELKSAGLITTEKRGREVICSVKREMVSTASHYFRGCCE